MTKQLSLSLPVDLPANRTDQPKPETSARRNVEPERQYYLFGMPTARARLITLPASHLNGLQVDPLHPKAHCIFELPDRPICQEVDGQMHVYNSASLGLLGPFHPDQLVAALQLDSNFSLPFDTHKYLAGSHLMTLYATARQRTNPAIALRNALLLKTHPRNRCHPDKVILNLWEVLTKFLKPDSIQRIWIEGSLGSGQQRHEARPSKEISQPSSGDGPILEVPTPE